MRVCHYCRSRICLSVQDTYFLGTDLAVMTAEIGSSEGVSDPLQHDLLRWKMSSVVAVRWKRNKNGKGD